MSHEISEAITDPNASGTMEGTGWTIPGGGEIMDPCYPYFYGYSNPPLHNWPNIFDLNGVVQIAGQNVQRMWSSKGCRCVIEEDLNNVDVLANGQFDITVFRPSTAQWFAQSFSPNWNWGQSGDIPYAGDFNGDGRTEFAILRPSPPTEFVLNIVAGTYTTNSTFSTATDRPVPGDYDNPPDGKTDLAVWSGYPGAGWRFISSRTGRTSAAVSWGYNTDIPVPADYDNDGITDMAVLRPSNATWYILPSSQANTYITATWGEYYAGEGDVPVVGDFNGDGWADFAFWDPSVTTWYVWYQNTGYGFSLNFAPYFYGGGSVPVPVAHDVDGDWTSDLQVWQAIPDGIWSVLLSSNWAWNKTQYGAWGQNGDIPIGQ